MKQKLSMTEHVSDATNRRLVNSEYQRGFMEGEHKAAEKLAQKLSEALNEMLAKYNGVATMKKIGRY
ncbi:MAG: hypothetical protein WCP20_11130 [Desulfuromonadales bacterium]